MFALSQLVDIPYLFRRLDALPGEISAARRELWAARIEVGEAQREYDEAKVIALGQAKEDYAECKNPEQRDQFKTLLFMNDETVRKRHGFLLVMQEQQAAARHTLDNLNDDMSSLRKKIDLIIALTMGRQETTESVLLRRLLEIVRTVPGREGVVLNIEYEDGPGEAGGDRLSPATPEEEAEMMDPDYIDPDLLPHPRFQNHDLNDEAEDDIPF